MSLTYADKQSLWNNTIGFFYPEFNPFSNAFSANDINEEVADILYKMVQDFSDCVKLTAPLELIAIMNSIWAIAARKHAIDVGLALNDFRQGPGSLSAEGCRNVQAGSRKTDLYMAFMGL